jgi:hypothetical protein
MSEHQEIGNPLLEAVLQAVAGETTNRAIAALAIAMATVICGETHDRTKAGIVASAAGNEVLDAVKALLPR